MNEAVNGDKWQTPLSKTGINFDHDILSVTANRPHQSFVSQASSFMSSHKSEFGF